MILTQSRPVLEHRSRCVPGSYPFASSRTIHDAPDDTKPSHLPKDDLTSRHHRPSHRLVTPVSTLVSSWVRN